MIIQINRTSGGSTIFQVDGVNLTPKQLILKVIDDFGLNPNNFIVNDQVVNNTLIYSVIHIPTDSELWTFSLDLNQPAEYFHNVLNSGLKQLKDNVLTYNNAKNLITTIVL